MDILIWEKIPTNFIIQGLYPRYLLCTKNLHTKNSKEFFFVFFSEYVASVLAASRLFRYLYRVCDFHGHMHGAALVEGPEKRFRQLHMQIAMQYACAIPEFPSDMILRDGL